MLVTESSPEELGRSSHDAMVEERWNFVVLEEEEKKGNEW